jgi:hypothetical protein
LFDGFPLKHPHFHPFERSDNFQDVVRSGRYDLNVIDYLEVTDNYYLVAKYVNDIHKKLGDAIALIAIQKKDRNSPMPLGKERAIEKCRLAVALSNGNRDTPNVAEILKCKNRKVEHSMLYKKREYKLVNSCNFITVSPEWK